MLEKSTVIAILVLTILSVFGSFLISFKEDDYRFFLYTMLGLIGIFSVLFIIVLLLCFTAN